MSVRFCISCKRNKSFSIFFRYLNLVFVFLLCVFSFVIAQADDSAPAVEIQTAPPESSTPPAEVPQTIPESAPSSQNTEIPPAEVPQNPVEPVSSNQNDSSATSAEIPTTAPEVQNPSDTIPVSSIEVELVPTVVPSDAPVPPTSENPTTPPPEGDSSTGQNTDTAVGGDILSTPPEDSSEPTKPEEMIPVSSTGIELVPTIEDIVPEEVSLEELLEEEKNVLDNTDDDPEVDLRDPAVESESPSPEPEPETSLPPEEEQLPEALEQSTSIISLLDDESRDELPTRTIEEEIVADSGAKHMCRLEKFRTDVSDASTLKMRVKFQGGRSGSYRAEIGSLPTGIDVVFASNKLYTYDLKSGDVTLDLEVVNQVGSIDGDFTIPIIYTKKGETESSVVCQMNLLNDVE